MFQQYHNVIKLKTHNCPNFLFVQSQDVAVHSYRTSMFVKKRVVFTSTQAANRALSRLSC